MYNTPSKDISIDDLHKLARRFNATVKIQSDIELSPDGTAKAKYIVAIAPEDLLTFALEHPARATHHSRAKIIPEEIEAHYARRDDAFGLIESILTDGGYLYDPRTAGNNSFPPKTMLKITSAESVEEVPYNPTVIRRWLNEMYGLTPRTAKPGPAAAP